MAFRSQHSDSVRSSQIRTLYTGVDCTVFAVFCFYLLLLQYAADILKYSILCIFILEISFNYTNQMPYFCSFKHVLYFTYMVRLSAAAKETPLKQAIRS